MAFLMLAWVSLRSLRLTLERLKGGVLDHTTVAFLQRMGKALIWVVAVILYAHVVPGLRSLGTALLAGASVASILVGGCPEYPRQSGCRIVSAIVSAVPNR